LPAITQLLRPGKRSNTHRYRANYHVGEGTGYSVVGDEQLEWEDKTSSR
jgi:gentisate 1,2-dioxygenase